MSTKLILRTSTIEDFNSVVKIFREAIEVMNNNGINQWDSIYPNGEILKEDILKGEMFLGEIDSKIACVFVLNRDYDEEYNNANWKYRHESFSVIHRLCVNPNFQNLGVAKQTMKLIEEMLRKEGIGSIRLDAFSLNPFALRLYEKMGYERVGEANWRMGLFYLYEKKI